MDDDDRSISRRGVLATMGAVGAGTFVGTATRHVRRQDVFSAIDPVLRFAGMYSAYRLSVAEFVGTIHATYGTGVLQDAGYERRALSAAKYHPETGELDDVSLRRVDPDNPRWQWHVHLWQRGPEVLESFSHYEYRPDFRPIGDETLTEMRDRIRDHFDPKWDTRNSDAEATYFLGEACPRLEAVIDEPDG